MSHLPGKAWLRKCVNFFPNTKFFPEISRRLTNTNDKADLTLSCTNMEAYETDQARV